MKNSLRGTALVLILIFLAGAYRALLHSDVLPLEYHYDVITSVSGNTKSGKGVLKMCDRYSKSDWIIYRGECRDDRPHGKGVMEFCTEKGIYKTSEGTWKDGIISGGSTYTVNYRYHNIITKEVREYKKDKYLYDGSVKYFNKKGELVIEEQHNSTGNFDHYSYLNPAYIPLYSENYIKDIITGIDSIVVDFTKLISIQFFDRYYISRLGREQAVYELKALQDAIDKYYKNYYYHEKSGIKIYEPATVARLRLLVFLHASRVSCLGYPTHGFCYINEMSDSVCISYESAIIDIMSSNFASFAQSPVKDWPSKETVIETFEKASLPRQATEGIEAILMPFYWYTNGYAQDNYIVCFARNPENGFKTTPSLVMHEFGHTVERRFFAGEKLSKYWKVRYVEPGKSDWYDNPHDCFAEDYRELYSRWDRADFKRKDPGMYGDIRDYPDKAAKVKSMIDEEIEDFESSAFVVENLRYGRVFFEKGDIIINAGRDCDSYYVIERMTGSRKEEIEKIDDDDIDPGEKRIDISDLENGTYKISIYNDDDVVLYTQMFWVSL